MVPSFAPDVVVMGESRPFFESVQRSPCPQICFVVVSRSDKKVEAPRECNTKPIVRIDVFEGSVANLRMSMRVSENQTKPIQGRIQIGKSIETQC